MNEIGITERGDAALNFGWLPWVREGNPAILITKDPKKLLFKLMDEGFEGCKYNIIVHTTITGLGGTRLEPNVPTMKDSLKVGYQGLICLLSIDRVVLRIDPVIPTDKGIQVAKNVLKHKEPNGRVRVSFIDLYPHTKQRLKKVGISLPWDTFHAPLELRKKAYEELGRPEICGEPDFECTGCVSELDCKTLGVDPMVVSGKQRKFCACLMNKKELLNSRHPCGNCCVYCYWKK
jgi:hypothetical protein